MTRLLVSNAASDSRLRNHKRTNLLLAFFLFCFFWSGYHTLLAALALRCLPHRTFLQYVDHRFLRLTDTFVSRLMTGAQLYSSGLESKMASKWKHENVFSFFRDSGLLQWN